MTIKKWVLTACALVLAASLTYTSAYTQDASGTKKQRAKPAATAAQNSDESGKPKKASSQRKYKTDAEGKDISPYSLASRTAMNRLDCKPNALKKDGLGIHGHYRTYGQWDPELKSVEGRRQFEACVKRGLEPTPWFAFGQRIAINSGGKFFGRGKDDCLKCHSKY